jgi:hypothetical protein
LKRITLLASLVGALTLTVWLGNARPAFAAPVCNDLNGSACSPEGRSLSCIWEDGWGWGGCSCFSGTWFCT